ncbi:MAG: hypothetical protein ACJ8FY_00695 [Gemmataceae bacterium]
MATEVYRYTFLPPVQVEDVEATLLLALWGAESLYGESQVRLDATHFLDAEQRACVIDAGTLVGRDVNRLFIGFVRREYGTGSFRVERVNGLPQEQPQAVPASA